LAAVTRGYLAWRGHLEDREAPLFLTDKREPHVDNGNAAGGQTKTAFKGMARRTRAAPRGARRGSSAAPAWGGKGRAAHWVEGRSDIALLGQLTPH
jgi:hypothetical protein